MTTQILNLSSLKEQISDRDLELLCRDNPDARLEIDSTGQLIAMSPTGGETGNRNSELIFQVKLWNKHSKLGKIFDSSTGFKLSNGAVRSPDVSWVKLEKWNSLTKQQQRKFLPLDPDFVIELMSPTDELKQVQKKMEEYMSCGVRLGWLINPDGREVEIYRQGEGLSFEETSKACKPRQEKEILNSPSTLNGEDILPGLTVDLTEIFD